MTASIITAQLDKEYMDTKLNSMWFTTCEYHYGCHQPTNTVNLGNRFSFQELVVEPVKYQGRRGNGHGTKALMNNIDNTINTSVVVKNS